MRVKSIAVKGLFGTFDHEIPLTSADRVTIIHGPNGFGKTMMLRMIAGLLRGETSIFEHTPFAEFFVTLEDETSLIVRRRAEDQSQVGRPQGRLEFLVREPLGTTREIPPVPDISEEVLDEVDNFVPAPYRRAGAGWEDDEGLNYSLNEILEMFPRAAAPVPLQFRTGVFETLGDLKVFFVQANRLGEELEARAEHVVQRGVYRLRVPHERPGRPGPRVEQYSRDVVGRIQTVLADYAKHSQESDRTFPERLVRFVRERHQALPEREILDRMAELENKRRRLIKLGLLDSEKGLRDLTEEDVQGAPEALTIYVEDVQQKLEVFDDIAQRIGSLVDIVRGRFEYKRLSIDRQEGFRVLSHLDQPVALRDLSSGEQHELVVLYELLFRAPQKGLVLIDEPEISLHVAWQSRFLSDLIEILKLSGAYAVVATHSPIIIGTRSDLAVELKGPPPAGAVLADTPN